MKKNLFKKKDIQSYKIAKKNKFIIKLTNAISNIYTSNIPNKESLEAIIQEYVRRSDFI